jgi:hypothetical protein
LTQSPAGGSVNRPYLNAFDDDHFGLGGAMAHFARLYAVPLVYQEGVAGKILTADYADQDFS